MLLILATLASCVTYTRCVDKFGRLADSVAIRVAMPVDTVVIVREDSVQGAIDLDTLCAGWYYWNTTVTDSLIVVADSLVMKNRTTRLETLHWIDKYKRALRFKAKVQRDTIHIRDTVYRQANCPPVMEFDKRNNKDALGFRALWQGYQLFAAWALLVLIAVLIFLKQIKNLFK